MNEPMTLGAAIDKLHAAQKVRAEIERNHDKLLAHMKAEEAQLEQFILVTLQKDGLSGSKGMTAQVNVKPKTVPQVQDWLALFSYIKENNAFDLLQKRIGSTAWKERVEAGVVIPGVQSETFSVLSVTKIS